LTAMGRDELNQLTNRGEKKIEFHLNLSFN